MSQSQQHQIRYQPSFAGDRFKVYRFKIDIKYKNYIKTLIIYNIIKTQINNQLLKGQSFPIKPCNQFIIKSNGCRDEQSPVRRFDWLLKWRHFNNFSTRHIKFYRLVYESIKFCPTSSFYAPKNYKYERLKLRVHICEVQSQQQAFTVNDGLGLSSLLLLFPQRLGGFQFVHLGETQRQRGVNTVAPLRPMGLVKAPGL